RPAPDGPWVRHRGLPTADAAECPAAPGRCTAMSLENIPLTTIDGRATTLAEWAGRSKLIVNLASRCGLTPQYAKLEELQRSYGERGFTVLGFPSNQFAQELDSDE